MKNANRELRARAYHEAGHAMMCLRLGQRIKTVSIVEGEQHLGFCEAEPARPPRTRKARAVARFHLIAIGLAGPISEALYLGGFRAGSDLRAALERGKPSLRGYESDLNALDLLPPSGEQRTRVLSFVVDFMCEEFELLWPDVHHIARVLAIRRTLSGEEVLRALVAKGRRSLAVGFFSVLSGEEVL